MSTDRRETAETPGTEVIYAAPRDSAGGEAGDGSRARPMTVEQAQSRVRRVRTERPDCAIEVRLLGDTYRPQAPLVFNPADSGAPARPVRWRNAPGESPVLSAAVPVEGWRKLDHAIEGLPEAAADLVWYADVGAAAFRTLYDRAGMLPRAAVGPLMTDPQRDDAATRTLLCAKPGDLHDWAGLDDVELFIMPKHVWQAQYLPVASVDAERGELRTAASGTYELVSAPHGNAVTPRYWIENVPSGLSEPGRWMLDSRNGIVYLWPRESGEPTDVLAPRLTELVRFDTDENGRACHHIELRGLTFTHGDRIPWPAPRRAVQHDWQLYDWPDAMVRLRGARDVRLRHCRFTEAGATGLRMDGLAVGNAAERCDFSALGGNAVAIVGDEPGRAERAHHNAVLSCDIRDVGRLWWQASGILVAQSASNRIADNHIRELPYGGITLVSGREGAFKDVGAVIDDGPNGRVVDDESFGDSPREFPFTVGQLACRHNVVEFNDIHDVMQRMGDGNGIYISGTGWGNVICGNYVHDIPSPGVHSAVRTDDMQWYTRIERNVLVRVAGAGLTLKHVNDMTDNVVVDCLSAAAILSRRTASWGANVKRNIVILNEAPPEPPQPPAPFYGGGGFGGRLDEPNFDDNVLWCPADPDLAIRCIEAMRAMGRERHSIAADPKFRDPQHDDYRLADGSPAWDLGVRPPATWGPRGPVGSDPHARQEAS
ncbi:MAG: hypothetical protein ACOC8F_02960 [Planctomycetota bacterium]